MTWSSTEDDRTNQGPASSLLLKSKDDSVDRDEVFQKAEGTSTSQAGNPVAPNTPLNPSPRVSRHGVTQKSQR